MDTPTHEKRNDIGLRTFCSFGPYSSEELASSVKGAWKRWERGQVMDDGARISTKTRVRVLRAGCAR